MTHNDPLIEAMRQAVRSAPDSLALRRHLAEMLAAAGLYEEAVEHYREALNLAPNDLELKTDLAAAYAGLGKPDVALVIIGEFLEASSPPLRGLMLGARLYLEQGTPREASVLYHRAVVGDPGLADPDLEARISGKLSEEHAAVQGAEQPPAAQQPAHEPTEPVRLPLSDEDEDAGPLIEVERPRITFIDVGGMDKVKEEIRMKIIYPLTHTELFRAYGKPIGGGILMYGPPGCGKTYLARATAGEVKANFVSIGLHEVLGMYMGQSEQNLHRVFDAARKQAPCVLFFDEVDALGASRGDMRHNAMRQVINQFLAEMDGVDTSNEGVLILAATNTPWYVDTALRRPGRFDRVLFVPPPDVHAREAILRIHLAGKPAERIDYARLARETNEFSGADLRGLVDHAIERKLQEVMRSGSPVPLFTNDLLAAVKETRPTTREWLDTARNYAIYSNDGGMYDEILAYLKIPKRSLPPA